MNEEFHDEFFDTLKGHIFTSYIFSETENTLSLTIDNDKIYLIILVPDCCSNGKFLYKNEEGGFPDKVNSRITAIEGFTYDINDYYKVYSITFKLENHYDFSFVYDNTSNGYYGTNLKAYYKKDTKDEL
jgi:hypothetical protein